MSCKLSVLSILLQLFTLIWLVFHAVDPSCRKSICRITNIPQLGYLGGKLVENKIQIKLQSWLRWKPKQIKLLPKARDLRDLRARDSGSKPKVQSTEHNMVNGSSCHSDICARRRTCIIFNLLHRPYRSQKGRNSYSWLGQNVLGFAWKLHAKTHSCRKLLEQNLCCSLPQKHVDCIKNNLNAWRSILPIPLVAH